MQPIAELNVTNLIDLGFMLMIIFMVVASQVIKEEQSINVKLPLEARAPQVKPDPTLRTETVTVDASGKYYLTGRPVTFRELQARLKEFNAETKPPVIRLAADKGGLVDNLIQVWIEIRKHPNITKIDFATEAAK